MKTLFFDKILLYSIDFLLKKNLLKENKWDFDPITLVFFLVKILVIPAEILRQ